MCAKVIKREGNWETIEVTIRGVSPLLLWFMPPPWWYVVACDMFGDGTQFGLDMFGKVRRVQ
jgi:hypothetical protein